MVESVVVVSAKAVALVLTIIMVQFHCLRHLLQVLSHNEKKVGTVYVSYFQQEGRECLASIGRSGGDERVRHSPRHGLSLAENDSKTSYNEQL